MEPLLQTSISINDYSYKDNLLACDKDAKTYKAIHLFNKDLPPLAFKGYPEDYLSCPVKQKRLIQELRVLDKLRGFQNILQKVSEHHRDRMVFIITQYCEGGDLETLINRKGALCQQQAIAYIQQIINGYKSVHQLSVIHRLLDPSNILLAGLDIKIGDFSHAIYTNQTILITMRQELVGCPSYQAPQVLQSYNYSVSSDIYSIGLIFCFMLKGQKIFKGQTKAQIIQQMKSTNISELVGGKISHKSKRFLLKTLNSDVQKRMGVEELLNYNFQLIPKLCRNKLLSFNNQNESESQKKNVDYSRLMVRLDPIQEAIGDSSMMNKSSEQTQMALMASEELVFNHNNKVSIVIAPKNEEIKQSKSRAELFKLLAVSNNTYDYQPSLLILPNSREPSQVSGSSRASKASRLSKAGSVVQNKIPYKRKTTPFTPPTTKQPSTMNHSVRSNLKTKKQQSVQSPINQSIIEVNVRSPLRRPNTSRSTTTYDGDIIANWLLSQVDFSRYLTRTCYYLGKLEHSSEGRLLQSLLGLRGKLLRQTKYLQLVEQSLKQKFVDSPQNQVLQQIISRYEEKVWQKGREEPLSTISNQVHDKIIRLFSKISEQTTLDLIELKVLDHLTSVWQLLSHQSLNNLQLFYDRTNLQSLLQTNPPQSNMSLLLSIHSRLTSLNIIST